jgi:hypothetical protein
VDLLERLPGTSLSTQAQLSVTRERLVAISLLPGQVHQEPTSIAPT